MINQKKIYKEKTSVSDIRTVSVQFKDQQLQNVLSTSGLHFHKYFPVFYFLGGINSIYKSSWELKMYTYLVTG